MLGFGDTVSAWERYGEPDAHLPFPSGSCGVRKGWDILHPRHLVEKDASSQTQQLGSLCHHLRTELPALLRPHAPPPACSPLLSSGRFFLAPLFCFRACGSMGKSLPSSGCYLKTFCRTAASLRLVAPWQLLPHPAPGSRGVSGSVGPES